MPINCCTSSKKLKQLLLSPATYQIKGARTEHAWASSFISFYFIWSGFEKNTHRHTQNYTLFYFISSRFDTHTSIHINIELHDSVSQYKPHHQYSAARDGEAILDVRLNTGNVAYIGKQCESNFCCTCTHKQHVFAEVCCSLQMSRVRSLPHTDVHGGGLFICFRVMNQQRLDQDNKITNGRKKKKNKRTTFRKKKKRNSHGPTPDRVRQLVNWAWLEA